ncbi:hypothetical protein Dimus_017097 [Dionaea muscipula]
MSQLKPQPAILGTSVIGPTLQEFCKIIFQNNEDTIRSWHLDGYAAFWPMAYGNGWWNPSSRKRNNKVDASARHPVQVYPKSWNCNTSQQQLHL